MAASTTETSPGHSAAGPLAGVRVIDMTHALAGPFATQLLGDLGATVYKIERPDGGDHARAMPPLVAGMGIAFLSSNRNKRSVAIDVAQPGGQGPDSEARRPLGCPGSQLPPGCHAEIRARPRGPPRALPRPRVRRDKRLRAGRSVAKAPSVRSDDPGAGGRLGDQRIAGGTGTRRDRDRRPRRAALRGDRHRRRPLRGPWRAARSRDRHQYVRRVFNLHAHRITIYDAIGKAPVPSGDRRAEAFPMGTFTTADGFMVIAALTPQFWVNLCTALERPEWNEPDQYGSVQARSKKRDALALEMSEILKTRTNDEWTTLFMAHDVPCGAVTDYETLMNSELVEVRHLLDTIHPVGSDGERDQVRVTARPIKWSGFDMGVKISPPALGTTPVRCSRASSGLSQWKSTAWLLRGSSGSRSEHGSLVALVNVR